MASDVRDGDAASAGAAFCAWVRVRGAAASSMQHQQSSDARAQRYRETLATGAVYARSRSMS